MKRWIFVFLFCLVMPLMRLEAREVQSHGVLFEKWVRDTFFDGYQPPSYTQKWDIPKEQNKRFGGIPVNPKAAKYAGPVDLGDALRQRQIEEPFILLVGFWRQEGDKKRFVNVVPARIDPKDYEKLWGGVTLEDLKKLDTVIKETPDYKEARRLAQEMKKTAPFKDSIIQLNPKIDSKTQRRLQCSLSFANVFKYLAPTADPAAQERPLLWGVPVPEVFDSAPRVFEKKAEEPTKAEEPAKPEAKP